MKLLAFEAQRPTTNLIPDKRYSLSKDLMKSGFFGVFNKFYEGDARKTLLKIALGGIMDTATILLGNPPPPKTQEERNLRKQDRKRLALWEEKRASDRLSYLTSLKKVNGKDPHFLVSLPIVSFPTAASLDSVVTMFSAVPPTDEARHEIELVTAQSGDHNFPAASCVGRAHISPKTAALFLSCLESVTFKTATPNTTAFLNFKVRKDEAEALVSTDWVEIRPVDLYPIFMMWVEAEYVSKFYGKSAIALSKIAATLPPHLPGDERIDKFNIGIDMNGDPLWIPSKCDNTAKYESLFTNQGLKGDVFELITVGETDKVPQLPSNIPVLVDWVNNKFTYSSTVGKLVVMPLEHVRKCNASMAMNILNRHMHSDFLTRLVHYSKLCNVQPIVNIAGFATTTEEHSRLQRAFGTMSSMPVEAYYNKILPIIRADSNHRDFAPRYTDLSSETFDVLFRPLSKFVKDIHQGMVDNLDAMYTGYAVSTVTEALGLLSVIACYGGNLAATEAESNTHNIAYEGQGLDPKWTPPPAPLLTAKFGEETGGLLPHQSKIRNLLRESPDFAMLSVDAGGGKSSLAITDILYEIKHGRSAPYLVMCPAHLVANYVSEIVEFTDGKVNCIPVTSYNIRTSGIARYEEILKVAPINTILVVDYAVLKFRGKAAVYGTTSVTVYPVIEMIRKFKPGYCLLDESHFLRNSKSLTFQSVMSLIADIPKKRLASGTINPDSPSDLPGQVAILDPTIFGSRANFNDTYGAKVSGNRVLEWRTRGPNSVADIMTKLKSRVVWASAKRKEWACALPPRQDRFIPVELSENQRRVYNAVFDDMVKSIREKAETDKTARKLLDRLQGVKATAEDESDFGDLGSTDTDDIASVEDDVGPGLQPYLADIERFVTNPTFHPYAKNGFVDANGEHVPPLSGDDLMPPKARVLKELMLTSYKIFDPTAGKILVFVNYTESAQSIYNAMPKEIQACGILYNASEKTELVNKFKKDPKIKWMIGIRKSLEVGLNLQQASVLVRLENVWTPGEQEQGDSRISRPYFGPGGDQRQELLFDTIVANKTIDVTKAARLRAKIVALAKFENPHNPNYEDIPDIPIIPMTLQGIQGMNDFETNLAAYQHSMARLNRVVKDENEEYKQAMIADGGFKFTQVQQAPTPPSCGLLARVPYAQGTELYKASELGLIRVDNYLGLDLSDEEDEEDDNEGEEVETATIKEQRAKLIGIRCHTEYGDGSIVGAAAVGSKSGNISRIHVNLDDGSTARGLRATNVFVITRTETNGIDMRNKLAQAAGLPVTAPITVPALNVRSTKITKKMAKEAERQQMLKDKRAKALFDKKRERKKLEVSLQLDIVNGYMQVGFVIGKEQAAARALEALGFKLNPQYYFTRIRTYKHLIAQAQNWAEAGFEITSQVDNDTFQALAAEFASGGVVSHRHYAKLMAQAQFQNYMRKEWKPNANKKLLNLFALVTDGGDRDPGNIKEAARSGANPNYGVAYLCLPAGAGHPSSKRAISAKYKAPSSRWLLSNPTLTKFVGSIQGVHKILDDMKEAGITVNNIADLNRFARSVKKVAPKVDSTVTVDSDEKKR